MIILLLQHFFTPDNHQETVEETEGMIVVNKLENHPIVMGGSIYCHLRHSHIRNNLELIILKIIRVINLLVFLWPEINILEIRHLQLGLIAVHMHKAAIISPMHNPITFHQPIMWPNMQPLPEAHLSVKKLH